MTSDKNDSDLTPPSRQRWLPVHARLLTRLLFIRLDPSTPDLGEQVPSVLQMKTGIGQVSGGRREVE